MSHFTVTAVIRNATSPADAFGKLHEVLAPFDENMTIDPYVEWLTDEEVGSAVDFFRRNPEHCTSEEGPTKPFEEFVSEGNLEAWREWTRQAVGAYHSYGVDGGVYDAESDRYGRMSTYNPQSKWDWWALGGRWHGFYQLKPGITIGSEPVPAWRTALGDRTLGEKQIPEYASQQAILGGGGTFGDSPTENFEGRADLARKGDIDFAGARTLAEQKAALIFDEYEKVTKGIMPPPAWKEVVAQAYRDAGIDPDMEFTDFMPEEEDIERRRKAWRDILNEARQEYHNHPWIAALRDAQLLDFMGSPHDDFYVGHDDARERYIRHAGENTVTTFAILDNGEWHERGSMGWFGIVTDEEDPDAWNHQFWTHIQNLPDDVYLAVVDCHI